MKERSEMRADYRLPARVQGTDSIIIGKPADQLWPLIADSTQLTRWGPPVVSVQVLDTPEVVDSRRTVEARFGRKGGSFSERRVIHDEDAYTMAFVIESDTFGIGKMLDNVGSLMQMEALDEQLTRLTWSFFHEPRGPLARLMNRLVILRQQFSNRLKALTSFKIYAETGPTRPLP
jgi:uncharacterized membrane protein